ncbi:MAG: helix-turn-helix domain-containing protein [Deltaproteobacteria bacterium]|nr:helix-turn-helix domain-containing protein [Deltaproteobacteria bacterium]
MEGKRIKAIREKLGLSQKDFGELLGVHFTTVNRWERERFDAEEKTLKILEFLELILRETEKKKPKIKIDDLKKMVAEIKDKSIGSRFSSFFSTGFAGLLTISPLISLLSGINLMLLNKGRPEKKKPK